MSIVDSFEYAKDDNGLLSERRVELRQLRSDQTGLRISKRIMDIVLVCVALPIILPVVAALWLLVRRDGGPGFFGHTRVGLGGKPFKCWKIRTMVVDAQAKLEEYLAENPEAAKEWELDQKLTNDPRVTRFGNFLRETSLDELPQVWNILRGDMSLVGPRPVTRDEVRRYGWNRTAYLSMKPGLTGFWQAFGRNSVTYEERVRMDVQYLHKMSIWEDVKIILKTVVVVLDRTGK